jgi:beta-phosphoglucomutase-like phosphatase (HAD superfamily)/choline kinase
MNIIIPIGGKGERFLNSGYTDPKPLIDVFGKPMISHVLDNLFFAEEDRVFIIYYNLDDSVFKDVLIKKYPRIHFIRINHQTKGAAETIFEGLNQIRHLTDFKKTMLFDCDTFYTEDVVNIYRQVDENAIFYVKNYESDPIYSYIRFGNYREYRSEQRRYFANMQEFTDAYSTFVNSIAEKNKISDNANTGIYCFKDIDELFYCSKYVVENNVTFNNECYTSCIIDQMIQTAHIFVGIELNNRYVFNLGTPLQLESYVNNSYTFLFDLDGTIVLTENIYYDVWKQILIEYDYTLTQHDFKTIISGNSDEFAISKLGLTNKVDLQDISSKKDELFISNLHKIKLVEGIETVLKEIKQNGHQIALVTNCNRISCNKILEVTNLNRYFEFTVIGNECRKPKPFSEPYEKAIQKFKSANLKTIIFEDSKTGLLSAYGVSPKCIIGIETNYTADELISSFANIALPNFSNFDLESILKQNFHQMNRIKRQIQNSLQNVSFLGGLINIEINDTKLKGGFISDVIDIKLHSDNRVVNCIGKMENTHDNFLTKMSKELDLYNREYYFYEHISKKVPVNTPAFYGLIRNDNSTPIGILLENINDDRHILNLNLNVENVSVSLKIIDELANMHSAFWDNPIDEFYNLKKNNAALFNPSWNTFIQSNRDSFVLKWKHLLTSQHLSIVNYVCDNFLNIQEQLSNRNLTFCHGDVKSPNIFYRKTGIIGEFDPVFIDWQYIAFGKGVQDLVFFMIESFDTNKMKLYKNEFKEYYFKKILERGVEYSREDYEIDFVNASHYFPFFVAIWFGTLNEDELIDKNFPRDFITRLFNFYTI